MSEIACVLCASYFDLDEIIICSTCLGLWQHGRKYVGTFSDIIIRNNGHTDKGLL